MVDPTVSYALTSEYVTTRESILSGEQRTTLFCKGVLPNSSGLLLLSLNSDIQEGPIAYYGAQLASTPTPVNINTISQVGNTLTVTTLQPHGAIPGSTVIISGVPVPSLNGTFIVSAVTNSTTYIAINPIPQVASSSGSGTSMTLLDNAACTLLIDPSYSFKYSHSIGTDVTLLSDRKAYVPDVSERERRSPADPKVGMPDGLYQAVHIHPACRMDRICFFSAIRHSCSV
jgi:hypothetical protein